MPFTGTPIVTQVSDNLCRITGVSVLGAQTGSIGLHEFPVTNFGTRPDIRLPASFRPRTYEYGNAAAHPVSLQDSIQVWSNYIEPGAIIAPVLIQKAGTTPEDFVAIFAYPVSGPSTILRNAQAFAVLGGTAVNNAGATAVTGDLGVAPGAIVTGFPPGTVDDGTIEINTPLAQQAHTDATDAFVDLAARTPTQDLSGTNLGGLTLTPGVYKFTNAAQLTGALTLDAENNVSASFVFQVGTTMTFDPASTVTIINVSTLNVAAGNLLLWQVGTTVSIGAGAALTGSVVAAGDITAGAAATMTDGRLLSLGGTVALDTDTLALPPALAEGLTTGELEIYVRFH